MRLLLTLCSQRGFGNLDIWNVIAQCREALFNHVVVYTIIFAQFLTSFLSYPQTSDSDYASLARDLLVGWVAVHPEIIQSSPFLASVCSILDHNFFTDEYEESRQLPKVSNLIKLLTELLHCNVPITSLAHILASVRRLHIQVRQHCQQFKSDGLRDNLLTELESSLSSLEGEAFKHDQRRAIGMEIEDRIIPNRTFFTKLLPSFLTSGSLEFNQRTLYFMLHNLNTLLSAPIFLTLPDSHNLPLSHPIHISPSHPPHSSTLSSLYPSPLSAVSNSLSPFNLTPNSKNIS